MSLHCLFQKIALIWPQPLKPSIFGRGLQKVSWEVCRVLKPNGLFLIVNESDGTNRSDEKWLDVIEGLQIFDKAQLSNFLKDAGFSKIIVDHDETKHRLCIMAMK